ncbi:MAG: lipopolysaccharide heptosyltransferase I [Zoogloea sp.]|nr:lipopolysaccharide heptosyltransferase I [Zoogloea sp.]
MRVLIVKTSSLGDVIHMLPAVTDAARAVPGVRFDWLVEESFAAIPAWHPAVDKVITVAMRRWRKHWREARSWREIGAARAALRADRYDLVLDTQGLLKSALWTRQARGPHAGYDRSSAREPVSALFYERNFKVARELHAVERNRRLTAAALGYAFDGLAPDYGLAGLAERLPAPPLALPPRYVVGLHGTSRADKEWPEAGWIDLAATLAAEGRPLCLPWGNPAEEARAKRIAAAAPGSMVLPRLGLDALAVIIDRADAVVGVDTGLMHLAAGLGKPGLALYTATRPALTGVVPDRHAAGRMDNRERPDELAPAVVTADLLARLPALA